ncbi:MAG: dipeptide ABC transporter ATP-binding protein [Rothia sp. (in: high G+C Gram-positive bacteria)]|nr:dipeptide ABC transporter ATP-binding protein [Rothia sp. (in: high G+C Gram-positive bacteria)]
MTGTPVLSVKDLNVSFNTENGIVHAVRGINFDLHEGKTLGIVGESGSGKSVASMAIMGLHPTTADIRGSIQYKGKELLGLSDKEMGKYRGNEISMIFQDPLSSLTPVYTIGDQIGEVLKIHNRGMSKQAIKDRSIELMRLVGIPDPANRLRSFPHEFSGGMRQRVMIAMAIANDPRVLIADEPTTALDVTIQAQVLEVMEKAQDETGAAIIMITHDLGVVAGMADDIMVMYAGKPVEMARASDIYAHPAHPYTIGLLGAVPRVDRADKVSLVPIEGTPPNLLNEVHGCSFRPRCPIAKSGGQCCKDVAEEPELRLIPGAGENHFAASDIAEHLVDARPEDLYPVPEVPVSKYDSIPREERPSVIEVKNVKKHFPLMKGSLVKRRVGTVKAVNGVSFDIREGECFSIVGESGCGKTTTLLEIMEFSKETDGEIVVNGTSTRDGISNADLIKMRKNQQMVFQDPTGALDPRFTVYEVLAEPLENQGWKKADIQKRVLELMHTVGLQPDHVNRFPNQFSGGQRQRIGIARALAVNPKLVALDEPVSALDVSVQAGVINLLEKLRADLGLSYLMVAHDLAVVRHASDRVAVMYLGRIVEIGHVDEVFDNPVHPYTRALLSAIPVPDPEIEATRERIILEGDLPTPVNAPEGCPFSTRCPIFKLLPEDKQKVCTTEHPALTTYEGRDHGYACYFPDEKVEVVTHEGDEPVVVSGAAGDTPWAPSENVSDGVPPATVDKHDADPGSIRA